MLHVNTFSVLAFISHCAALTNYGFDFRGSLVTK